MFNISWWIISLRTEHNGQKICAFKPFHVKSLLTVISYRGCTRWDSAICFGVFWPNSYLHIK